MNIKNFNAQKNQKIKIIAQGAEAVIYLDKTNNKIIKHRIKKPYRIPEIDIKLRQKRTRAEIKILEKASKIINSPIPKKNKDKKSDKIIMEFIKGDKLSNCLDGFSLKKQKEICRKIGEFIALLHKNHIIHSDLTTSNMILSKKNNNLYFIDFGLGFISSRFEDKAVDIHLLKQALEAKHFKNWETLFNEVINNYKKSYSHSERVLEQLKKVEKRGRYKK